MLYLSRYEEYPIYEPAEGGYYYAGNQLIETERLSRRQAKKKLNEIWKELQEENAELERYGENTWYFVNVSYRSNDWDCGCFLSGRYIGEGQSIILERKAGSHESGYEPYC